MEPTSAEVAGELHDATAQDHGDAESSDVVAVESDPAADLDEAAADAEAETSEDGEPTDAVEVEESADAAERPGDASGDEAPVAAEDSVPDEALAEPASAEASVEPALIEASVEPASKPASRRRRARATITEVAVEQLPADPAPEPLSLDELPTLDELVPRPAAPHGRRRRRQPEPVEAAEAGANGADTDPVAESLVQLSRTRGRRRAAKTESEAAAALDELAAAIGSQLGATADEPTEESDESATPQEVEAEVVVEADTETDSEDETDAEQADAGEDGDESGEGPRRRRRRRGGRRRRRGGAIETTDDGSEDAEAADGEGESDVDGEAEASEGDGEADSAGETPEGGMSTRRRRRRRRRGEDTTGSDDDPTDVVVRVRQPRRSKASDEVTGIDGSTRMEAKRQRRREGRAAGRRRAPILSEAEFLARREAVDRKMLIRQADDYTQIAVVEDGILVEHYVDRASATSMIGNVYLGKVQNVLPSMEAAFIDIGRGRNAVLYAGEVDWDGFGVTGGDRKMEKVFKSGQSVLVQVSKDPVGAKGARLTAHVSIPGRYVVYSPGGQLSGISRKLPEGERSRLKGILDDLVGDTASVIVRTAAEGASEEELVRDVNRLKAQWEIIEKKVKAGKSPTMLYAEPDLTVRIVRDLFTEDFGQLIVDGNGQGEDAWDTVDAYVSHVAPHLKERLQHWNRDESGDLFQANRIDEQIAKALERKVFLPSGGSLIIDRTEAMTVIDVNTGKFTGTSGNLEATVTSNNLEAAEEIVRQLRLRDIGGIIVIDFIDMVLPANRELLLRRLVECLGRDRTRHQVAEVTSLGLVQMTRKKIGTGLAEAFTVTCETCHGRGYHRHDTPVDSQAPSDGGERDHGRRRRN
ncbi:Rne/Rng family ribonuclease [Micropruina sp.]|uniref:Rne/Rng family ribonuclease n=1 Tax=Micropruina sp. TaxID=2737536 RepID=UPI0039E58061